MKYQPMSDDALENSGDLSDYVGNELQYELFSLFHNQ